MNIPLEDEFNDVIAKAQRGLGLSDDLLARQAGISRGDLERLKGGNFEEALVRKVAPVLSLAADALIALGRHQWYPEQPGDIDGLACFNTPYGTMTVNAYLVWDPRSSNAVCFDTGADAAPILKFAAEREIRIHLILLTHTHPDHIADLETLTRITEAKAFVSKLEGFPGAETFDPAHDFRVGGLIIGTRQTSGHSPGGTTYVVRGLSRPLAVVGDALFAGSMGGGMVSYTDALNNNRQHILTLPQDTVICPGHGPLTTVGQEKLHNPFFQTLKPVSVRR